MRARVYRLLRSAGPTTGPSTWAALVVVALTGGPHPAVGQSDPVTVGAVGGYVHNEQRWSRDVDTDPAGGPLLGAWVDVPTGLGWLSVTAEGAWARRGGDARFDPETVPGAFGVSPIRTDVLAFSLQVRATAALGPVRVHVSTGPALDQVLRSRLDPVLEPILEEVSAVYGWTGGAGVRVPVGRDLVGELEVRIVEGLRDAYSGTRLSVRNRSLEVVARVGLALRSRE